MEAGQGSGAAGRLCEARLIGRLPGPTSLGDAQLISESGVAFHLRFFVFGWLRYVLQFERSFCILNRGVVFAYW